MEKTKFRKNHLLGEKVKCINNMKNVCTYMIEKTLGLRKHTKEHLSVLLR